MHKISIVSRLNIMVKFALPFMSSQVRLFSFNLNPGSHPQRYEPQ